ncbi:MAG: Chemotaxis protein methyltransferase CheR [Polyangiaceae bacterium]|jgi:two-component system CheB/CheR fusion protein|nr:Chemotaxis protein methyltransferase CheR [Polyangiaceae bacterium]
MTTEDPAEGDLSETVDRTLTANADGPGEAAGAFPVVGIGASAGGLSAFEAFFSAMPADQDSGMAFVLVQHLAPDHKSILVELVQRYTRMEVFEVTDGMRISPNCAYVIPPNHEMALSNGALQLIEPVVTGSPRLSIDFFLRSLAQDQGERAICVILSGSGSDGTLGMRAIKAEGGMAMAQTPTSAEYDAMPRSAIDTGLVDFTLPPAEMPAQLLAYVRSRSRKASLGPSSTALKAEHPIKEILALLRAHTGHDFAQFKMNTINRRVERRMVVHKIDQPGQYLLLLQEDPAELEALFRDLLIGVTKFFRDAEAFDAMQEQIARRLASTPVGSLVRVWAVACSTGEEAYSLAILFREHMELTKQNFKLQVFGTDIDSRAIATARAGLYPSSIVTDVSPERLSRWFSPEGDCYRINKSIRDTLIFSEHDVVKDPPFSRLDFISCRNLLIYMGPELQRKLIQLFHYALNQDGVLLLGSAETVGDSAELFAPLERKAKLYRRQQTHSATGPLLAPSAPRATIHRSVGRARFPSLPAPELPPRELTERALLARAPVGVLVNARGDLLYVHGHTGRYLQPAPGEAGLSIFRMARDGLAHHLQNALQRASTTKELVCYPKLRLKADGSTSTVNLTVEPIWPRGGSANEVLYLIAFEEIRLSEPSSPSDGELDAGGAAPQQTSDARIALLTQELRAKDEYLRSTQEEAQIANEQLRSANEELQSINEELQSTNEELETSKEELQSVNEELATVNAELETKVSDLSCANNDLNNLMAGTGVGTIFVDHQLCVRRFTPAVTPLVNLIRTDVGRPLGHIVSNLLGYDSLALDVKDVLETLIPKELEVKTQSAAWFLLRIRPYRTLENVIEGAVVTFTEITEQKRAQRVLLEHEALRRMAAVMRDSTDAITVQGLDGQILAWNRCATARYGWSEAEALTMNIRALIPDSQREAALAVVRRLAQAEVLEPFRTQRLTKDSKVVEISMTATALVNGAQEVYAVFTTER